MPWRNYTQGQTLTTSVSLYSLETTDAARRWQGDAMNASSQGRDTATLSRNLVLGLASLALLTLSIACSSRGTKIAELKPNESEFTARLDQLAKVYEARGLDEIMAFYDPETYSLSFDLPWKFTTGVTEHRDKVAELLNQIQSLRVAPGESVEVWRDEKTRTWTTRPLKASWVLKNSDVYEFDGYHSAIWEQRNDTWLIAYEHLWGNVRTLPRPTPAPTPTPAPPLVVAPAPIVLQPVFFDLDKYNIRPDQVATMDYNLGVLLANPSVRVVLAGHCDDRASRTYNMKLGDRRAATVKKYLVERGVAADRLEMVSYGKERPFESGRDETSRQLNRRVQPIIKQ
jgi:peptidoglycan-associated lipoprotein